LYIDDNKFVVAVAAGYYY